MVETSRRANDDRRAVVPRAVVPPSRVSRPQTNVPTHPSFSSEADDGPRGCDDDDDDDDDDDEDAMT